MCFSCDAELLFILGNMMVPAFKWDYPTALPLTFFFFLSNGLVFT
jgi:hypothetical protein